MTKAKARQQQSNRDKHKGWGSGIGGTIRWWRTKGKLIWIGVWAGAAWRAEINLSTGVYRLRSL